MTPTAITTDHQKVKLWFDGACEPRNPGGIATAGWITTRGGSGCKVVCIGKRATNNVAEWSALEAGLCELLDTSDGPFELEILGDSRLVIHQLTGHWGAHKEHLRKLRDRVRQLLTHPKIVDWSAQWVPRDENREADRLSRQAYENFTGKPFPERHRHGHRSR